MFVVCQAVSRGPLPPSVSASIVLPASTRPLARSLSLPSHRQGLLWFLSFLKSPSLLCDDRCPPPPSPPFFSISLERGDASSSPAAQHLPAWLLALTQIARRLPLSDRIRTRSRRCHNIPTATPARRRRRVATTSTYLSTTPPNGNRANASRAECPVIALGMIRSSTSIPTMRQPSKGTDNTRFKAVLVMLAVLAKGATIPLMACTTMR